MPKCNDCSNVSEFISVWRDITVSKYEGEKEIDSWSISYEPTGESGQCADCNSDNVDWFV